MKKFSNIYINDSTQLVQYVFIIDGSQYYKFNGKFAMYEMGMCAEKREYALRQGNTVEYKQVYGLFCGKCPSCGHNMENVPIIKNGLHLVCYCEHCSGSIHTGNGIPISAVIGDHSNRKEYCVNYEAIDFSEEVIAENDEVLDEIEDSIE